MKKLFKKIYNTPILFCSILSFVLVLIIESLSRHDLFGGFVFLFNYPIFFFINLLIISFSLSISYFFKRRIFSLCIISIIYLTLGIINFVLLCTRVSPFIPVDILVFKSCYPITSVYFSAIQLVLIILGIILVLAFIVFLFIKTYKEKIHIKSAIATFLTLALSNIIIIFALSASGTILKSFDDLNKAYDHYGFTFCFIKGLVDGGIDEPEDYSEQTVSDIIKEIDNYQDSIPKDTPNIIMIQLESFMDVSYFNNITFSQNPVPFFSELKKTCMTGHLSVPFVGSGTANTEFEVLTGMNLDSFGSTEYPYTTFLKNSSCESICFNLEELGYNTFALHNNTAIFYDRHIVYKNIGFETFIPLEYMSNYVKNYNNWADDMCLKDYIINSLKSTDGSDFVFAVSVQDHGAYPSYRIDDFDYPISCEGLDNIELTNQFEYYVSQLKETDNFIEALITELSSYSEHCVVVLYGDHQPSIEYSEDSISLNDKHLTDYVVWTNYGNEHIEKNLESYQLSAYVLEKLNIHNGIITKLHQNYSENDDYLDALELIEYDMIYGDMISFDSIDGYYPTYMKFGLDEIKINNVVNIDNHFYLVGENFTPSSVIYVNNKTVDFSYISENVILIENYNCQSNDHIVVSQIADDATNLGSSNTYIYFE